MTPAGIGVPGTSGTAGTVRAAVAALSAGRPVLLAGRAGSPCDAVLPAATAGTAWTAWLVRYTSGLLRVPLEPARADALRLPALRAEPGSRCGAVTVSVDAEGVGTGISAADRAFTARVLADPAARPDDLRRPGHLLPVRVPAGPGGTGVRATGVRAAGVDGAGVGATGAAEAGAGGTGVGATGVADDAALALCRAAGLPPVALAAGLVGDGVGLADRATADRIAARYGLVVVDPAEVLGGAGPGPGRDHAGPHPRPGAGTRETGPPARRRTRGPAASAAVTPTRELEHL